MLEKGGQSKTQFPKSIWIFAAIAALLAVELIPIFGWMVSAMLSAFIIPWVINIAFLAVGLETFAKNQSKAWLALPILWFGGYFVYMVFDNTRTTNLRELYNAENKNASMLFDPSKNSLVLEHYWSSQVLVSQFNLPVSYQQESNGDIFAFRVGSATLCKALGPNMSRITYAIKNRVSDTNNRYEGQCVVALREEPKLPTIVVDRMKKSFQNFSSPNDWAMEIRFPKGLHKSLHIGQAEFLPWIPQFTVFCGFGCSAKFMRNGGTPLIVQSGRDTSKPIGYLDGYEESVLANALALAEVDSKSRVPIADEVLWPLIETSTSGAFKRPAN